MGSSAVVFVALDVPLEDSVGAKVVAFVIRVVALAVVEDLVVTLLVTPVEVPVPDSVAVMFCAVTLVVTLMVDALEVVGTGVTVVPVDVTAVVLVLRRAVVVIGALVVVKVVDWFVLGPDADGDGVVTAVVPVTFPAEAVELPLDVQIRLVSQMSIMARTAPALSLACAIASGRRRPPGLFYS